MNRPPAAFVLFVSIPGAACGADEPSAAAHVEVRDTAGVTIVESITPAWEEGEAWEVGHTPLLDITESGAGLAHEFFRATDATRLSDGSLVVSDAGANEIRIFSPDGAHLRTIGREGEGPGEFRRLSQVIALPDDSILAYDYWQGRVTVFSRQGELGRVLTVEGVYRPRPLLPLQSGGFVGQSTDFAGFREEPGLHRMTSPIVRVSDQGVAADTLARIPGYESVVFSRGDARAVWGRSAHVAVSGNEVYLGTADSVEYRVHSPDGGLQRIVRVPGYDLTLSRDEIRAEKATYLPEDPSTASPILKEVMDLQPDRTHRPAYSDMLVDARGHVWLKKHLGRHESDEPTEWLVFDPTGQWLGSVRLPPRFEIFRVGPDWILGKRPDELDVDHIQLLSLARGGTAP